MSLITLKRLAPAACLVLATWLPAAQAAKPAELLAEYTAKAGAEASVERGEKLFTTRGAGEMGWAAPAATAPPPPTTGATILSEKSIPPLAPAANANRFTDRARVEGWFKTNCNDVLGRSCTAAEKADLLSWLLSLKP